MHLIVFVCLATLFASTLPAQEDRTGTVRGSVIDDSTKRPVEFVNVLLRLKSDSGIVTGKATDRDGKFYITDVPAGEYILTFSLIGYQEKKTPAFIIDKQRKNLNAGVVALVATEVALEEVLVAAERSLYNASIDRKVYNADQDLMSKSGTASELLQNVPSVEVDIDGNVSLRGSSDVMIMVNGRTSSLMKRNSATALQQIPASSIDRVEVITNPSAKYKPDGSSGIINIVLKKNMEPGLNGSITGNAGNQDRYNGNVRLNYQPGALNLFGGYGIRRDNRNRINTDNRLQVDAASIRSYYNETVNSFGRPLSHILSLGADYKLDMQNEIGISGDYFYNTLVRTENGEKFFYDADNLLTGRYNRNRIDDEIEKEYNATAFFEHRFPAEDHTLKVELNTEQSTEHEDNFNTNVYVAPAAPDEYDNALVGNDERNSQITIEYADPLSEEASLEAGYNGEFIRADFDFYAEYFDGNQQRFIMDTTKTNRFLYDEDVHAVFATYKQSFGELGVMAGVRAEAVSTLSNLMTLNTTVSNSYVSFYPTLHATYELNEGSELQVSYSRRTRRPDGDELNPFPEYRDPRNVSVGNPKLLPEYVHSVELGCQFQNEKISILPALFYRYTYNRFTSVTQLLNDTLLLTTRQNLSSDQSGGLELVVSADVSDLLSLHGNANVFLNQINASNLGYSDAKSVATWSGRLTVDMNLNESSRLQVNSNFNSSRLTPQGEQSPSYSVNTGFRQELLDGDLTMVITIADIFKTVKRENMVNTPSLSQTVVNMRDSRIVYAGFTYRFGVQPKKSDEDQLKYDDGL